MATLVLGVVGSAVGGALLPGGLTCSARPSLALRSAARSRHWWGLRRSGVARTAGRRLRTDELAQGPRVIDLKLGASSEGTPLPRVYGRARLPGQLIWATRFKEKW